MPRQFTHLQVGLFSKRANGDTPEHLPLSWFPVTVHSYARPEGLARSPQRAGDTWQTPAHTAPTTRSGSQEQPGAARSGAIASPVPLLF